MPILVGTDGVQKMSKSLDNYIGVEEPPNDMYGKVMRVDDDLMMQYFEYLTDVPGEELQEMRGAVAEQSVNPMELKKRLAREITTQFHGPEGARAGEAHFERVVQRRETPSTVEMPRYSLGEAAESMVMSVADALVRTGTAKSAGEAKRWIKQGAVEINGEKVSRDKVPAPAPDSIIRVGRRYVRITD
jgi:tyrosyl-tRNA synthetase